MNCFDELHALCQWPGKIVTSPIRMILNILDGHLTFCGRPRIRKYTISHRLYPGLYVLWEPHTRLSLRVVGSRPACSKFHPRLSSLLPSLPTPTVGASSKSIAPGNTPAIPTRQSPALG